MPLGARPITARDAAMEQHERLVSMPRRSRIYLRHDTLELSGEELPLSFVMDGKRRVVKVGCTDVDLDALLEITRRAEAAEYLK